jgi:type I restriction enzyme S subunit
MTANFTELPPIRFEAFSKSSDTFSKFGEYVDESLYGPRFNAQNYDENGNVRTIRGTDVGDSGELKYDQIPTAQIDRKTVETHRLLEGDLVMITTAECGLTGVYREQDIPHLPSAYAVRLRLNSLADPYYFKYFFQTQSARRQIASYVRKATVANLPGSDILRIIVLGVDLPEQRKIADFLTAVDGRIGQLIQKKALLEDYKKGLMQQLFTQAIRFKDDNGNDFPDWEEKKLEEIASFHRGSALAKADLDESGEFECIHYGELFTRYNEVIREVTSRTNIVGGAKSHAGDILMPSSDVTPDGLAKASSLTTSGVILGGDINVIRPVKDIDSEFLSHLINYQKNAIIRLVTGTTVKHLYNRDMATLILDLPSSLPEQTKIADFLSAINRKIESVATQIAETQTFKRGLLQQMFV